MRKTQQNIWTKLARRARHARRFGTDDTGATVIEFALLAPPFFALIGAILETALVFLSAQILDSAVQDSSRFIRTGQAQSASYTAANFRSEICDRLFGLFDCDGLRIKVSELDDFSAAGVSSPVDTDDGSWTFTEAYNAGGGSSIELVEVYYKWPVVLDLFGFSLSGLPDNTRLMGSVRVFRNEPF